MEASSGLSANALAKAAGISRSTAADGLQRLAKRAAIKKDAEGRWRLEGEERRPMSAPSTS
jgi:DNA-binding IclR family transcriptional regulator